MTSFPSDKYFDIIKTEEDYDKFVDSGMAWEWEPDCPMSWSQHLQLLEKKPKLCFQCRHPTGKGFCECGQYKIMGEK